MKRRWENNKMLTVNLAVVGVRQYDNYEHFEKLLTAYLTQLEADGTIVQELITIDNSGVNAMVIDYCKKHNKPLRILSADWDKIGKSAYFETNTSLIERATHIVALWDRVDALVGDAIDKGLRQRRAVKFYKIALTDKGYAKTKEKPIEQTSDCETVPE